MAQHSNKMAQVQAVTANRLIDGVVVYLTAKGAWSEKLADAAIAEGKEAAEALLAKANPALEQQELVEPYLFEIAEEDGTLVPASVRERIRMAGPTVRLDLGKQAEGKTA